MATWGFVGLGEMGEPMVRNLAAGGLRVIAFDRDPARLELARAHGAEAAASLRELTAAADVVCVCVRDEHQLEDVARAGFPEPVARDLTLVVHSTVGPAVVRRVASDLAGRGVTVVDAPISGMQIAAAAGTLTFFVGAGDERVLAAIRPGLEAMGSRIEHVGHVGAGQVVKLANNLVAFGTVGLVREVVEMAAVAGVERDALLGAMTGGTSRSWVIENWDWLTRDWLAAQPGGSAAVRDIVDKDLELGVRTAAELAVDAPFARLAAASVAEYLAP